jgi:hypothetical protein
MNKSYSLITAIVSWAVITASPLAGELNTDTDNTLNVFVAGTTAVAANVNDNFEKIADAVNDNNTGVDANTAAITTNTAAINDLQTDKLDSADLGAALDTATTTSGNSVDGNAADILINATAISVHTTAISNNATAIADNTADITSNTAAIIVNTADIADNTAAIAANTTAIVGKLSTSALGTALASPDGLTPGGNSIDGNAAAIALKADATDVTANTTAILDLQQHANRSSLDCAGNDPADLMVRVGPLCVDVHEASLWDSATGGNAIDASTCSDNGNDCSDGVTNIYARSVANTAPDANITWFQALQACANSGKRLLTNAEWQMAAAGTPDPGSTADTINNCNTNSGAAVITGLSAGGTNACVSNWGAFDMIGNLNEWTADWMHGTGGGAWTPSGGTAGSDYGLDTMSGTNPATNQGTNSSNFPGAVLRGSGFSNASDGAGVFAVATNIAPSFKSSSIGFRCAR